MSRESFMMKARDRLREIFAVTAGEKGMVLFIAILVMVLLSLMGLTFLTISATENTIASNEATAAQAFGVTEAGLAHSRRYLAESLATTGLDPLLVGSSGNPPTPVPVAALQNYSAFGPGDGTYNVFVANNTTPYGAIAADPDPQDDTDNRVWVTAVGSYREATRTVRALIEVNSLLSPPAAIDSFDGFDLPNPVGFDFSGNAFQVTGNDTPSPEPMGACGALGAPKTGIAVESPPALTELDGEILPSQEDNVTGAGGDESIAVENSITLAQIQALKAALIQNPDITWSGSTNTSSNIGSPTDPVIAYADDHLNLEGNGKGYGILIVERRLIIRNTFKWEGLILLIGQGEFEIEGDAEVYGAILAANTGPYSGNSGETRVKVRGNSTVAFSSQALCRASSAMPTIVLAWHQL